MSRNVTIAECVAVWAAMLECASQASPRGSLESWDDEDVAAGLGLDHAVVTAIREAMEGKVLSGNEISAWITRQPKREDNSASDRKRAQRDRQKECVTKSDKDSCHSMSRNVTTETETETETEKKEKQARSSAAPNDASPTSVVDLKAERSERLAQVADDAIRTFNASKLTKANGGLIPNISATIGREKRRTQVSRCIRTAREICLEMLGSQTITPEFWEAYWTEVLRDDHAAGRSGGGKDHPNWVPDFEYLTRESTMLKIYDRAASEDAA
ncbi:hypothetical protein [Solilutibacter silvestris]|uniref:hypothetical protein n=1 Tax=Solilutibacter silvestris TaxID=1645665 RepID=UPI003D33B89B